MYVRSYRAVRVAKSGVQRILRSMRLILQRQIMLSSIRLMLTILVHSLTKDISLSLSIHLHDEQNRSGVQIQMQNQQLTVCLRILVDLVHQI